MRGEHDRVLGGRARLMEWREHITVDLNVCHGQACVAGTRWSLSSSTTWLQD